MFSEPRPADSRTHVPLVRKYIRIYFRYYLQTGAKRAEDAMWPSITHETCAWERDPDELALIPKSRRRKILSSYEAAVPATIASEAVSLPRGLSQRILEVEVAMARFDQAQAVTTRSEERR